MRHFLTGQRAEIAAALVVHLLQDRRPRPHAGRPLRLPEPTSLSTHICLARTHNVIEATEAPPSHAAKRGEQAARPESWRTWTFRNHLIGSLLVLGVGSIMIAGWSLATGGIGWDAPTDTWAALQVQAVPSSDSLAQAYNSVYLTSEFYGVFIQQFADLLHTLFTGSTHHLQPDDPATCLY